MSAPNTNRNTSCQRPTDAYLQNLLSPISQGKTFLAFRRKAKVYSQGSPSNAVFFVDTGRIKISTVSSLGTAVVTAVIGPRGIFGETCLASRLPRSSTATALDISMVFRVELDAMQQALTEQPMLSSALAGMAFSRIMRLEETLVDQMLNNSEKRLANILLRLATADGNQQNTEVKMPKLSHETLAEMVATTRPRITYFMNKFRKNGVIDWNAELIIRPEALKNLVQI